MNLNFSYIKIKIKLVIKLKIYNNIINLKEDPIYKQLKIKPPHYYNILSSLENSNSIQISLSDPSY